MVIDEGRLAIIIRAPRIGPVITLVREGEMSVGNLPEAQAGASPPAFPADSLTSDRLFLLL